MISSELSTGNKRRVAIYIRVSTSEQDIDGYSLTAQEKRLTEYVTQNTALNLETRNEWLYQDVHTGSDLNRKGLQALLEDVRVGKFDAVLVWKIDRLSRSLKHLLTIFEGLESHDVSFISVQENIDFKGPIGKLIFQIFGAIAQFERELIKGRTQMGRITSAELGNYTGTHIPYGFRPVVNDSGRGKKLEIIPEEKEWVQQMYHWYIYEEDMGEGRIVDRLNAKKVPRYRWNKGKKTGVWTQSKVPQKWTVNMVNTILTNDIYRGKFVANTKDETGNNLKEEEYTIVEIPECVSEFTFRQAQAVRDEKLGGRSTNDYLLSGKLVDMTLDKPMKFVGAPRYKGGFSYRRKQFDKEDGSREKVFEIPGKPIEDYVWGKIMEAMKNPEVFIQNYLSKEFSDPTKVERLERDVKALRGRAMNIGLEVERIQAAYDHGSYSEEVMNRKVLQKEQELSGIETEIAKIEAEMTLISSVDVEVERLRDASEQVQYRLENLDRRQKRLLCNLFVERVEMYRKKLKGQQRQKWQTWADIVFRFNPDRFKTPANVGRTEKAYKEAKKSGKNGSNDVNGAMGGT